MDRKKKINALWQITGSKDTAAQQKSYFQQQKKRKTERKNQADAREQAEKEQL